MKNNQKIPEGWSVKKLKECLEIKHGKPQHDVEDKNGIYPILASGGEIGRTNSFLCNKPSVLIGRKGTIDKPQYMDTPFWTVDTLFYSLIKSGYLAKYIFYKFETINWNKYNEGSTIPSLSSSTIHSIKVILPPLAEQEKIAEILGTWDEAIGKLSSLIEQKKLLKKGLMQKLLTGKVRLPGSTRPWKEVKLGEIFNIKKGQGLSKEVLDDNGLNKCILYGELYTKYSEVIKDIESRTNQSGGILSQIGDILIPASTTTTGIDLANATALLKENVLLGGDINILRAKKEVSSIFFAYLLTHAYKFDIAKLAQGITIVHLYGEFLKNMKVYIPSDISEQQAIADVLSTADDEINLLNQKLEATKEQKKGLMQQLLTGQIRVKVN